MAASDGTRPCPICGKPAVEPRHRPFCSARCRQIDLQRWLGEVYRVPAAPAADDEDATSPEDDRSS
jgi:endogenous inhibitor of DNA gyrase (YacG/DUF329 family)